MLSAKKKEALLEAAEAWTNAAAAASLQLEYGYGKAVDRAQEAETEARKTFEDLLNKA